VAGGINSIEKPNDLMGTRTRDLPACSIVPQPITLPRSLHMLDSSNKTLYSEPINVIVPVSPTKDQECVVPKVGLLTHISRADVII
jgi:hypothetical protein